MQPVATVVAFAAAPAGAAAALDTTALACDLLGPGEDLFRRIKRSEAGSMLLLLAGSADEAALAAGSKAARILRKRGGGQALVVLPAVAANPGPQARGKLLRAAELCEACVVQPVGRASWADAVRCFVEPLTVFGLVGVEAEDVRDVARAPSAALLHLWQDLSSPPAGLEQALSFLGVRDVLLTCRLRPTATLKEVDDAAAHLRELAPSTANLVFAGPEVGNDEGPRAIAAVTFAR
jgi:hypothetical protein